MRPLKKAHPALLVHGLAELVARLEAAGVGVTFDVPLPGYDRAHIVDPFGNRIELMEALDVGNRTLIFAIRDVPVKVVYCGHPSMNVRRLAWP